MKQAVRYCHSHDILKEFLELHGTEVMNMLIAEWSLDDALAVRYEEGIEEGREEIARNALANGASADFVQKITGLDLETINSFGARQKILGCPETKPMLQAETGRR
jgi:hypothetical protein